MEHSNTQGLAVRKRALSEANESERNVRKRAGLVVGLPMRLTTRRRKVERSDEGDSGSAASALLHLLAPSLASDKQTRDNLPKAEAASEDRDVSMGNTENSHRPDETAVSDTSSLPRSTNAKRMAQQAISKAKTVIMCAEGVVYDRMVEDARYVYEHDAARLEAFAEDLKRAAEELGDAAKKAREVRRMKSGWMPPVEDGVEGGSLPGARVEA